MSDVEAQMEDLFIDAFGDVDADDRASVDPDTGPRFAAVDEGHPAFSHQREPCAPSNAGTVLPKVTQAMFGWNGTTPEHLTVAQGENLTVIDDSAPWWKVRNKLGQEGMVPSNYMTRPISEDESPSPSPSSPRRLAVNHQPARVPLTSIPTRTTGFQAHAQSQLQNVQEERWMARGASVNHGGAHKEGLIVMCSKAVQQFMTPTAENAAWYLRSINDADARRMLDSEPPGTFLIRLSARSVGSFVLVYKDDQHRTLSRYARGSPQGLCLEGYDTDMFATLEELVQHYATNQRAALKAFSLVLRRIPAIRPAGRADSSQDLLWFTHQKDAHCKRIVEAGTDGNFVVREASGKPGCYVLCVNDSGIAINYLMAHTEQGFLFADRVFDTVSDVVETFLHIPFRSDSGTTMTLSAPVPGCDAFGHQGGHMKQLVDRFGGSSTL